MQRAVRATDAPSRAQIMRFARAALERDAEITIRLVNEQEGHALNRDYRGRDYATNVLSFVYASAPVVSGDLVLCAPVVSREALQQGKSAIAHYAHLIVHGVLHLHGLDHENDDDAQAMEARETEIITALGFADPYVEMEQI
ncbi:endoribonuclease YbeY [Sulfuriferula plumbiphila]|uniref:Endoribonuclease YbeY n=1 Tax=Sulfuriferula plumbiphila TaxID=171865 RepID=A0A512L5A8_9PROT|nr:rRNA maturation RNase YbeY [Sulfuriferula plumbiphila]BBP05890.1 endoribonuclease YbeY [Sulfuriferula plumbiphila]GEP29660.1 endoribonuclease YbeY [Sulfuriferula plumbiphila]